MPRAARLDPGRVVVATLALTETVSWGILYYGFPVMLGPIEAELGWSRVEVTGALSLGLGVSALAALPVGRWIDRHGARGVMTAGSCLGAALLVAWARVESPAALYAVWLLMGLALAATLYEPAFAALVGWFPPGPRERALLTVTLAGALASTIFMPLEAWLVERLGWRRALEVLAVVLAVLTVPAHALGLRPPPRPAGRDPGPGAGGLALGAAARTAVFWVLATAFLVSNFATNTVTVHLIPYLTTLGYAPALAAAMVGWLGAMQLPARLLFAAAARRVGHATMTAAVFAGKALGLVQLALAPRLPTLVPMVLVLGAANGMETLARATTVADRFGARHYGAISGAIALGANGARAVAPVASAALERALGGYAPLFGLLGGAVLLAGVGVLLTARPGRPRGGPGVP